ncbi:hypothetical protein ACJ41O_005115 [Fusarium nematophilum]
MCATNAHASPHGRPAHLSKEYHYHILTLITPIRTSFHRRRLLLPVLYIILPRVRISTTLLALPNTLQLRRRLRMPRPRNRIPTPIVAIMNQSPILLSKSITGSNNSNNNSNRRRSNLHLRTSPLPRRRIQRIPRIQLTRRTAQEILP